MKEIVLSDGKSRAIVDDEDYGALVKSGWSLHKGASTSYAFGKRSSMHRVIMSAPRSMVVDHINGNGLDNRRENLRIVTYHQNSQNRKGHRIGRDGEFNENPGFIDIKPRMDYGSKEMKVIAGTDKNSAWRISLPKEACRRLGIIPGNSVVVRETKTGFVVVKRS